MSVINLTIFVNGALTDPTSVDLEDKADPIVFGVREVVTGTVRVAAGTAMTKSSTGIYTHTWSTIADVDHEYEFKVVYNGVTYYRNFVDAFLITGTTVDRTLILPDNTTYYSSQAEVCNVLGPTAVELLSDDFSLGDRGPIWNHLLRSVTQTVDLYIHQFYKRTDLLTDGTIRDKATILAVNLLTERRGNPELYANRVLKVYEELELIRSGRLTLAGTPERGYFGPMVRNYELETWRRYHPLRVESSVSMLGDGYSGQDIAWEYPFWF